MIKLPRIRIPTPRGWFKLPLPSSVRGRIIADFGLGLLVLVLGVAASLVLWQALAAREDRAAESRFHAEAEEHTMVARERLGEALESVQDLSGLYAVSDSVDRAQFQAFATAELTHPVSIQALEWIPRVPAGQRDAHEEAARGDGFTEYEISERATRVQMVRAGERDEYFPVYFVEPYEGNEPALGFDLGSQADRLEALNRARDSGEMTVTGRITLVQETGEQFGFLAFIPVYRKGEPAGTPAERGANLEGFVLGVYPIGDIVEDALTHMTPAEFNVALFDDSAPPDERFLYAHVAEPVQVSQMEEQSGLYHAETMELGDRQWRVVATPTEAFMASQRTWAPIGALVAGLVVTALVAAYLIVTGERRQAKKALRESEERLATTLTSIGDAVIATDQDGRVTFLNPVAQSLTGWNPQEAAGMPLTDILNIVSEQTGKPADNPVTRVIREGVVVGLGNDTVLIARDGTRRPIEDSAAPIRDSKGSVIGAVLVFHDVTERKRAEEALRQRTHDLGERVKELNCLYGIAQLVDAPDVSLEEIALGTADIIPPSWQYPEVTCARITMDGRELRTENFRETPWSQIAGITVRGERAGTVEVCYLEERPESDEGSFLKEERSLINAIAQRLGEAIERKQAEEALRESEERHATTLTSIGDAVIATDRDGRVTFLNPVAQSLTGWNPQEAIGMPSTDILNIVSDETGEPAENPVARVIRKGVVIGLANDTVLIARDGTRRPIEDSAAPIRDSKGSVIGAVLVFHDVSERKRAEEALRESEAKYHDLYNNAPDMFVSVDPITAKILQCNQTLATALDYTKEEIIGRPIFDMYHPDCMEDVRKAFRSFVETGEVHDAELQLKRKDGSKIDVSLSVSAVRDEEGNIRYSRSAWHDISERKQAEDEERRLNRELKKEHEEIAALNRSLGAKVSERTQELRLANEELRDRNRQLMDARAQAATDALTGLSNHRAFHERIREEVQHARESGSSIGLIMLDIDDFKAINDSQGHQAGDKILRRLARTLTDAAAREDTYRYGGDEFAVLLPGVDARKTARVAERLRRAVEKRISANVRKVTVSLGVASFAGTAASANELIYGADAAMYWAKSAGKNRVGDWSKLFKQAGTGTPSWYLADRGARFPDTVATLVAALAAKDPVTAAHMERCSWLAPALAKEIGLGEEEASLVRLAALLHDSGKLVVPDEVLFKPGPLNEEEWAQIKEHPAAAMHVLGQIESIAAATPAILHHHEHFDGSGYPDGLAGDQIPIVSRILLVVDAFDAMTTDRPYRKTMPVEATIEELKRCSGSQFDPAVVEAFLRMLSRHGPQPLHLISANHEGLDETTKPAPQRDEATRSGQRRRAKPKRVPTGRSR